MSNGSAAYTRLVEINAALLRLDADGLNDSEEAERLREESDPLWLQCSEAERESLQKRDYET